MPVKSLVELCTKVCIRNIHDVTSLGDLLLNNNDYVRQILLKVDNAAQLHEIELNSPQLQGELEEFWRRLIQKDFPTLQKRKNYIPRNPDEWHKVYAKLSKEYKAEREVALKALKANFADIQKEKDKHVSRILEKKDTRLLPKPPRTGRPIGLRKAGGKDLPTTLTFGAGSRMKMTTGQSVMRRVRREVKEIANTRSTLSTPSGIRSLPLSRISKAPAYMVNEKRKEAQPTFRAESPSHNRVPAGRQKPVAAMSGNYISESDSDEANDPLFGGDSGDENPIRSSSRGLDKNVAMRNSVPAPGDQADRLPSSRTRPSETRPVSREALPADSSGTRLSRTSQPGTEADARTTMPSSGLEVNRKRKAAGVFMKPAKRR